MRVVMLKALGHNIRPNRYYTVGPQCVVKRLRFQGDCEFNYCVLGPLVLLKAHSHI